MPMAPLHHWLLLEVADATIEVYARDESAWEPGIYASLDDVIQAAFMVQTAFAIAQTPEERLRPYWSTVPVSEDKPPQT